MLLSIVLISLAGFTHSQNPKWINYTNGHKIKALAEDGNNIWIGTNGGLVKLDKITGIPIYYNTSNSGMPDNWVRAIAIDGNGTKWIGTFGGGLAAYNEDGIPWIHENIKTGHLVSIYPNPVHDLVTIRLKGNMSVSYVEIIDIRGILAKYFKVASNKNTICIRDLPNGLYIVRLFTDNGTLSEKFIKK